MEKMVRNLAHEIRNPLTTLKGYSQLLIQRADDAVFVEKTVQVLATQVLRLENILDELYAAFQKTGTDLPVPLSLSEVCASSQVSVTLVENVAEHSAVYPPAAANEAVRILLAGLDSTLVTQVSCRLSAGTNGWSIGLVMDYGREPQDDDRLWFMPYQMKGVFRDGLEPYRAFMLCRQHDIMISMTSAAGETSFILESAADGLPDTCR